jgi:hypothetical protein
MDVEMVIWSCYLLLSLVVGLEYFHMRGSHGIHYLRPLPHLLLVRIQRILSGQGSARGSARGSGGDSAITTSSRTCKSFLVRWKDECF